MRRIWCCKTGSIAEINHEIARLEEEKFITAREAEAVDAEAIDGLFRSPLGRRMLAAKNMRREFKFSLLVGADEVFGAAAGEQVLLQGVVDCCIEEDGELVIIDYKTDRVRGAAVERRAETYAGQLRAYAAAMERITGKPALSNRLETMAIYICRGSISRIEDKQRTVTDIELYGLSKALDVSIPDLFGEEQKG